MKAATSLLVVTLFLIEGCIQIRSTAAAADTCPPPSRIKFAIGNIRSNVRLLKREEIPFSDILNDSQIRARLEYLLSHENAIQSAKEESLRISIEASFANSSLDMDDLLALSQEYLNEDRLFQSYQCIAIVVSCLQSTQNKFADLDSLQKDMETMAQGAYGSNLHDADAFIKKKRYSDAVVNLNYAARLSDNPSVLKRINWAPLTKRMRHVQPMVCSSQQQLLAMYIQRLERVAAN